MKNKRIFSLFICVLTLMSSISVSANENIISIKTVQQLDAKFESENEIRIINAEHRSDGVEITGEVIDGIRGNQVGVIVRDKTNKIVYLSQETLGERDKFGNSPFNFYFKPANDFSDYTVTISAKGCSTEVDVIKKVEKFRNNLWNYYSIFVSLQKRYHSMRHFLRMCSLITQYYLY